jgi:hypothetical protein
MTLKSVTITIDARKHHGQYDVSGQEVRVSSAYGSRRQAVARGKPADVARAALYHIVIAATGRALA